jgi:hypothetical protein
MPEVTNSNVEKTYTDEKTGKFVKGNPGGGRPEGSVSIVEGIKRKLMEIEPANKKTYLELFLSKLFLKAIKEGNEQLMKDMINRVDGMPKQHTEITGKDGERLMPNNYVSFESDDPSKATS